MSTVESAMSSQPLVYAMPEMRESGQDMCLCCAGQATEVKPTKGERPRMRCRASHTGVQLAVSLRCGNVAPLRELSALAVLGRVNAYGPTNFVLKQGWPNPESTRRVTEFVESRA